MLKDDELRIDTWREVDGSGGNVRVTHVPTGLSRELKIATGATASETRSRVIDELEAEMRSRGMTEFIDDEPQE